MRPLKEGGKTQNELTVLGKISKRENQIEKRGEKKKCKEINRRQAGIFVVQLRRDGKN